MKVIFLPVFQRYFSTSMFAPKRGLRLSKDEARNVEYRLSALDADAPPACPLYPGKKTKNTGNKGFQNRFMLL